VSLRERLAEASGGRRPGSKVQAALEALSAEDRALLESALADRSYTSERLSAVLTDIGHPVSPSTIREYRRSVKL